MLVGSSPSCSVLPTRDQHAQGVRDRECLARRRLARAMYCWNLEMCPPDGGLAVSISTRESRGYRFEPLPGDTWAMPGSTTTARLYGAHFQRGNLPVGLLFYWKKCASGDLPATRRISAIRPASRWEKISRKSTFGLKGAGSGGDGQEGLPDRAWPWHRAGAVL